MDESGKVLGRHRGIIHYTLGQRRGLGLSLPSPMYVLAIDPKANRVILGPSDALFRSELEAEDVQWISGKVPSQPLRCEAQIRYSHKAQPATIEAEGNRARIVFDEPQRAITPGQAVVLYRGDEVLGGGTILSAV